MGSEKTRNKDISSSKKLLTIGIVSVVVLMSFATLFNSAAASSGPSGTFIWGTPISTLITDLNPLTAMNLGAEAADIMYPSLLYSLSNGTLIPWLATSYSIAPNGTQYTFYLATNATWENGTTVAGPITANDVVFTFDVLKANSTLDAYGVDPYIKSVVAVNSHEVVFNLNYPSVMMLTYLGTQLIIPAAWSSAVGGNLSAIGGYDNLDTPHQLQAGPFILQSISESGLTFVANTHFWKGVPHVENFVITPFESTSAMTLSFESGTIDAEYPAISDYSALKNAPNVVNVIYKEPWSYFLWFDTLKTPFNNTHFRIGLAEAINKTAILQKAEDGIAGKGSFGGEPWTNTSWWAPNLPYYYYNLTNATVQFKAAGLVMRGGFWAYASNNTTVQLHIIEPPISDWTTAASLITNDLSLAGFEVTESVIPIGTWSADMFERNVSEATSYMSYFGATPSFSNPWYVLQDLYSSSGFWQAYVSHWSNSTVNTILNETAIEVSNYSQMMNNLYTAQRIIAVQVPMVLIGDIGNYYAYNSQKIRGFVATEPPDGQYNLMRIYVPSTTTTTATSTPIAAWIYAVIAVIVLIIIIVPVVLVMSKRGKANKEAKTSPPEEPKNKT
ncbi:MAG: ABC transporter substrate-binding protein [Candidatus Parvarchaeota archaeon]